MDELVLQELDAEGIAIVRINNPQSRNALARPVIVALYTALEALVSDPACRAIVLTGSAGVFCAGGDVSGFKTERPIIGTRNWLKHSQRVIRAIVGEKPVIVAVEGPAFGAGVSLAAASDFVVAADNAKFCAAFAKVGLAPDMGLFHSLPMRVGVARAKRMIAMAEVVKADEALRIGLVDKVVPADQVLDAALAEARAYAAIAPIPFALTKHVMAGGIPSLEQAFDHETDYQTMLFNTEDHRGAIDAFFEKRAPEFKGR